MAINTDDQPQTTEGGTKEDGANSQPEQAGNRANSARGSVTSEYNLRSSSQPRVSALSAIPTGE